MAVKTVFGVMGVVSLAVAVALAPGGAAASPDAAAAQGCTPRTNIEAIIDDSGSMSSNDLNELRRTGLELFIGDTLNNDLTLGAVEFGEQADRIFAPANIKAGRGSMISALRARINADGASSPTASGEAGGGGTDYNDGFVRAFFENQTANGRIFLTDGEHNEGVYGNVHRGGPPTYVVGIDIGKPAAGDEDANRLQQIATETGGRYFPDVEGVRVQAVFNTISAILGCRPVPKNITFPTFFSTTQKVNRKFTPARASRRVGLVLNWANPSNRFRISKLTAVGKRGRVLATLNGKGRPKKLAIRRRSSATFTSLDVSKPKGTRKFRLQVRAKHLSASDQPLLQASNVRRR